MAFTVNYNPALADHSSEGPTLALRVIFGDNLPKSILDVGCGPGAWLRAADELGVSEFYGVDGLVLAKSDTLVPMRYVRRLNLLEPFDLGCRFDWAFCLEVAEHLDEIGAPGLIDSLTRHADH